MTALAAEMARRACEELPDGADLGTVAKFVVTNFPKATVGDVRRATTIIDEIRRLDALEAKVSLTAGGRS